MGFRVRMTRLMQRWAMSASTAVPESCAGLGRRAFGGALGGDVVHLLAHVGVVDADLHGQHDDVAGAPVERESRSVVPEHEAEDDRHHEGHHAALGGIHARRRRDVLREEHGDDDEDGQDVRGSGCGEIVAARTSAPGAARRCSAARGSRRRRAASAASMGRQPPYMLTPSVL